MISRHLLQVVLVMPFAAGGDLHAVGRSGCAWLVWLQTDLKNVHQGHGTPGHVAREAGCKSLAFAAPYMEIAQAARLCGQLLEGVAKSRRNFYKLAASATAAAGLRYLHQAEHRGTFCKTPSPAAPDGRICTYCTATSNRATSSWFRQGPGWVLSRSRAH